MPVYFVYIHRLGAKLQEEDSANIHLNYTSSLRLRCCFFFCSLVNHYRFFCSLLVLAAGAIYLLRHKLHLLPAGKPVNCNDIELFTFEGNSGAMHFAGSHKYLCCGHNNSAKSTKNRKQNLLTLCLFVPLLQFF